MSVSIWPVNLKCNTVFVLYISWVQTCISHTNYPASLAFHLQVLFYMGVQKLKEESHPVTIASSYKRTPPCWGPSVGAFWALCWWCHSNAPHSRAPLNLLNSDGGRILGLVFCTRCFVLVCLFCRVMKGQSLPQSCSVLWKMPQKQSFVHFFHTFLISVFSCVMIASSNPFRPLTIIKIKQYTQHYFGWSAHTLNNLWQGVIKQKAGLLWTTLEACFAEMIQ